MPLRRLLAWLERVLGAGTIAEGSSGFVSACAASGGRGGGGAAERARNPGPPPLRAMESACLLSVDDAGQCLLVGRSPLSIGHLRSVCADLLFLADVGALHAELARSDSLRAGPGWRIAALRGERVEVEGVAVPPEGRVLQSDELVRLGENLEFRYRLPDPSSESACLELLHGVECCGARTVVLLGEGAGARVRIGAALQCHLRVPHLEHEIELSKSGNELVLRADVPLREGAFEGLERALLFPPVRRLDFTCGERAGSRPPFGFSFAPAERPGPGRERGSRAP